MCGARSTGAALLSVNFHPPPLSRQDFPSLLSSVARSASGLLQEGENMHWKTAIPPAHQVLHDADGGKPRLPVYLNQGSDQKHQASLMPCIASSCNLSPLSCPHARAHVQRLFCFDFLGEGCVSPRHPFNQEKKSPPPGLAIPASSEENEQQHARGAQVKSSCCVRHYCVHSSPLTYPHLPCSSAKRRARSPRRSVFFLPKKSGPSRPPIFPHLSSGGGCKSDLHPASWRRRP